MYDVKSNDPRTLVQWVQHFTHGFFELFMLALELPVLLVESIFSLVFHSFITFILAVYLICYIW